MQKTFWVLVALLGFGLLVMVHELGHLIAAKRGGIQVNEFWIGMGPKLLSHRWGETIYCLCLLPLGGACVLEGENGDAEPKPGSFVAASRGRRFLVLIAGVSMNLLTGFIILLCLTMQVEQWSEPRIAMFQDGYEQTGENALLVGDRIWSIDGYTVLLPRDVSRGLAQGSADGVYDITVERAGKLVRLHDVPLRNDVDMGDGRRGYGIFLPTVPLTLGGRLYLAGATAINDVRMVWDSLTQLATRKIGVDMLSGPVGVTEVLADTAEKNLRTYWNVVAFLSINLAVMNLLPIPGLDGGRLLLLIIEVIRRKPLPPKVEGYVNAAGFCALLALMFYITGNDIFRILQ